MVTIDPLWQYEYLYFIKYMNDTHALVALQKLFRLWFSNHQNKDSEDIIYLIIF